jgi:hypothetical protein
MSAGENGSKNKRKGNKLDSLFIHQSLHLIRMVVMFPMAKKGFALQLTTCAQMPRSLLRRAEVVGSRAFFITILHAFYYQLCGWYCGQFLHAETTFNSLDRFCM